MSPICEQPCAVIRRRESPSAQDRSASSARVAGNVFARRGPKRRRLFAKLPTADSIDEPLFRNAGGAPLTRDGVAYVLEKNMLVSQTPRQLLSRRVTPPVMRHCCAIALLQAGIDASVIPDYLGHAGVATTSGYVTTNLKMKRDVLETF